MVATTESMTMGSLEVGGGCAATVPAMSDAPATRLDRIWMKKLIISAAERITAESWMTQKQTAVMPSHPANDGNRGNHQSLPHPSAGRPARPDFRPPARHTQCRIDRRHVIRHSFSLRILPLLGPSIRDRRFCPDDRLARHGRGRRPTRALYADPTRTSARCSMGSPTMSPSSPSTPLLP
jgi:hypothetical protein